MKNQQRFFIVLVSIFIFLLVYSPHINYPFPFHIDEWHHITEAIKLGEGDYSGGGIGYRIGFHVFLLGLSYFVNLISMYQFLPAIWAVFTGLVLFYVVYKKTDNYWIALFSMIFFASLKSNVNIEGLWFFTSLTFSIPFIFLYVFFFTEGIEKQNKKQILMSLAIMAFLVPVHSISVLFAIPFLFVYCLFHLAYVKKEWKFFSLFFIIPILGIMLYSLLNHLSFLKSIGSILGDLQFKKGWGVLEINNSFFEIYSLIGYLFAFLGVYSIWRVREFRKYLAYLLWPVFTLVSILIFKMTGISFLAPYQRIFYYLAISLPFLSAFGLYYLLNLKDNFIMNSSIRDKEYAKKFISMVIIMLTVLFAVYHLIEQKDYDSLRFLENKSSGKLMAPVDISMASYAVSGKMPVGAMYFYGNRTKTEEFFSSGNCRFMNEVINQQKVKYVLSEKPIDCNWNLIYNETNLIYSVNNVSS